MTQTRQYTHSSAGTGRRTDASSPSLQASALPSRCEGTTSATNATAPREVGLPCKRVVPATARSVADVVQVLRAPGGATSLSRRTRRDSTPSLISDGGSSDDSMSERSVSVESIGNRDAFLAAHPTNLPDKDGHFQLTAANLAVAAAVNAGGPTSAVGAFQPLQLFNSLDTAWAADPVPCPYARMSYIRGELRRFDAILPPRHRGCQVPPARANAPSGAFLLICVLSFRPMTGYILGWQEIRGTDHIPLHRKKEMKTVRNGDGSQAALYRKDGILPTAG